MKHKAEVLTFGDLKEGDYFRFPKTPNGTKYVKRTRGWYMNTANGLQGRAARFTMVFLADPLPPATVEHPVTQPIAQHIDAAHAAEIAYGRLFKQLEDVAVGVIFISKTFPEVEVPSWAKAVLGATNY